MPKTVALPGNRLEIKFPRRRSGRRGQIELGGDLRHSPQQWREQGKSSGKTSHEGAGFYGMHGGFTMTHSLTIQSAARQCQSPHILRKR